MAVLPGAGQPPPFGEALEWPERDHVVILEFLGERAAGRIADILDQVTIILPAENCANIVRLDSVALDLGQPILGLIDRGATFGRIDTADIA